MADSDNYLSLSSWKSLAFLRMLCCSLPRTEPPQTLSTSTSTNHFNTPKPPQTSSSSFPSSPSPINSTKLGLVLGRRMLSSPGRVTPINLETFLDPLPEIGPESEPEIAPLPVSAPLPSAERSRSALPKDFDMRLNLKGKDGRIMCLELDSEVLRSNSALFGEKIAEAQRRSLPEGCCLMEVENVGNLEALSETIQLMYEKDPEKTLMKTGVSRAIDILEVSYDIMFDIGINSCLNYLEAVPWCESEEEKLKNLFTRCRFNEAVAQDVLVRLNFHGPVSLPLGLHIVESVTQGIDMNAKEELKSLVKGLLSSSSVYVKDPAGINKEDLYRICGTCLLSLENCFKEAYDHVPEDQAATEEARRPLIGLISEQVDNLNWLLEILMDRQMAEDFVGLWANQSVLLRMHGRASRMVRYELSRVSACIFIALGRGKLKCRGEERYRVLRAWFEPMLVDFGWLQRCSKGLDVRELEEAMGQALLTLSLNQQHILFMEWFHCYSRLGRECPNLSNAFQVWCRRIFSSAPEPQFQ